LNSVGPQQPKQVPSPSSGSANLIGNIDLLNQQPSSTPPQNTIDFTFDFTSPNKSPQLGNSGNLSRPGSLANSGTVSPGGSLSNSSGAVSPGGVSQQEAAKALIQMLNTAPAPQPIYQQQQFPGQQQQFPGQQPLMYPYGQYPGVGTPPGYYSPQLPHHTQHAPWGYGQQQDTGGLEILNKIQTKSQEQNGMW